MWSTPSGVTVILCSDRIHKHYTCSRSPTGARNVTHFYEGWIMFTIWHHQVFLFFFNNPILQELCLVQSPLSSFKKSFLGVHGRTFWRNSDEIVCYFSDMACCVFNPSPKSQVLNWAALFAGSPRAGRTPWGGTCLGWHDTHTPIRPCAMAWTDAMNAYWGHSLKLLYSTTATNLTRSADITPWESMILLRPGNKVAKIEHVDISCLSILLLSPL